MFYLDSNFGGEIKDDFDLATIHSDSIWQYFKSAYPLSLSETKLNLIYRGKGPVGYFFSLSAKKDMDNLLNHLSDDHQVYPLVKSIRRTS